MKLSLCALTGTPYWRFRYRSIDRSTFVVLNPVPKGFAADELASPKRNSRNWRTSSNSTGYDLPDVRLRAVKELRRISEREQIEFL
jgi:hypothetical protein